MAAEQLTPSEVKSPVLRLIKGLSPKRIRIQAVPSEPVASSQFTVLPHYQTMVSPHRAIAQSQEPQGRKIEVEIPDEVMDGILPRVTQPNVAGVSLEEANIDTEYNPSPAIRDSRGRQSRFVRLERKGDELNTRSVGVTTDHEDGIWRYNPNLPVMVGQDPYAKRIDGVLHPSVVDYDGKDWRQIVYKETRTVTDLLRGPEGWRRFFKEKRGKLTEVFRGPEGWKDLRYTKRSNGKIAVMPRKELTPDEKAQLEAQLGFGIKISSKQFSYFEVNSMEEITTEMIKNAPLINTLFVEGMHAGPNNLEEDENGNLITTLHAAECVLVPNPAALESSENINENNSNAQLVQGELFEEDKDYSGGIGIFNPDTRSFEQIYDLNTGEPVYVTIAVSREDLPKDMPEKNRNLRRVIFSSEYEYKTNTFIVASGDAGIGEVPGIPKLQLVRQTTAPAQAAH